MVVHFKVKRDQVEAVLAGAKKAVPASRAEKGCMAYDVQQNLEDPAEFFVLETWRDAKALQFHAGTDHFAEFIKVIGAAVEEAPQMRITKSAS
jgi:quinol monooxygenase YgiN